MNDFFILMKSELLLSGIIFLLLFIKLGKATPNERLLPFIQLLLLVNFLFGFFFNQNGSLFGNMYFTNELVVLQKNILNLALYVMTLIFADWFKRCSYLLEFFVLLITALMGLFFMISSGNLLMFYLSLEISTIPLAALANFDLHRKESSEAGMKLILSSSFSTGILLFGISLVYGATGTISFAELPLALTGNPLQILSFIFLFGAFAFKLSVVPFHLWTADVYEGSPIPVAAFLSVLSKGAVAFVFITFLYKVFQPLHEVWYYTIVILSIATIIIGNLFALRQQNLKRFLAFSSIAQVGFILVGIASNSVQGIAAVVYFVLIYVFSNLAAFGVAGVVEAKTGKTNINDLKGFYATNPFLSWIMALALFSLAGIPPTAGFFGKLFLLTAGASSGNYLLITIAALNMMVSLYYYLKIVRAIFMDKNETPVAPITLDLGVKFGLILCGLGVVALGLVSWLYDYIVALCNTF